MWPLYVVGAGLAALGFALFGKGTGTAVRSAAANAVKPSPEVGDIVTVPVTKLDVNHAGIVDPIISSEIVSFFTSLPANASTRVKVTSMTPVPTGVLLAVPAVDAKFTVDSVTEIERNGRVIS